MKVVVTGSGTGGHVTPIRYVAQALKAEHAEIEIVYIGQIGDRFADLLDGDSAIDRVIRIRAGKWRRYHRSKVAELLDFHTHLLNAWDLILTAVGYTQARKLLQKERPQALFSKGGAVGVPVGLAARHLHIPVVTHDSDMIPGISNKIAGRDGFAHAVGYGEGEYPYPPNKTFVTGIPIHRAFFEKSAENDDLARTELGIDENKAIILVIGGSLGSKAVNDGILSIASKLNAAIVHITGAAHYDNVRSSVDRANLTSYVVLDFIDQPERMAALYRIADVVVARGGATTIAELAAAEAASVIIPAGHLHDQSLNANVLKEAKAAIVIPDNEITGENGLFKNVQDLLNDSKLREDLSTSIARFARPDAAEKIASLINKAVRGGHER